MDTSPNINPERGVRGVVKESRQLMELDYGLRRYGESSRTGSQFVVPAQAGIQYFIWLSRVFLA
jgi:hypothetical protein